MTDQLRINKFFTQHGICSRREADRLIEAGRDIVPAGASVWAQIAPGNAASMRASIAAGFAPIGSEVLFPRAG